MKSGVQIQGENESVQFSSGVLKLGRYVRNRAGWGVYWAGKAV